jgi:hypothetical protein
LLWSCSCSLLRSSSSFSSFIFIPSLLLSLFQCNARPHQPKATRCEPQPSTEEIVKKMMLKLKSLHGGPHRLQNDLVPTTTMHGHTNLVKHPGFLGCGFLSKAHQEHKKLGLGVGLPKASRQPNIPKKLGLGWQQIGRGFVAPTGCAQSSSSHSFLPSRDYSSESRPEVVRRVISADADQVNGGQIPLEV